MPDQNERPDMAPGFHDVSRRPDAGTEIAGKKLLEAKEEAIARTAAKAIEAVAGDVAFTDNLRPNSVELQVNAKGSVQPTVKVYHDDPKEAAKLALETMKFVREQLGERSA